MKPLLLALVLVVFLPGIICPPVQVKTTEKPAEAKEGTDAEDLETGLEYDRYLQEVVSVLEQDESFKKKLEEANLTYIKSGDIANHLDFVSHGLRTKLDEIKRREVERLRELVRLQMRKKKGMDVLRSVMKRGGIDNKMDQRILSHLDHENPHTFEVDDLAKLIKQTTKDLEEVDRKRREDFKKYEMDKELARRENMKHLPEEERKKAEHEFEEKQKKHKDHPKMKHPGSKDQLEDVWEEQDHMKGNNFDPKTFFHMHDTNGDGFLDEEELEALFQRELDKAYDPNAEEDDMVERMEEMSRMREHMMTETDKDDNKLISLEEFLAETQDKDFDTEEPWKGLDEEDPYSPEEMDEMEKQWEREHPDAMQQGNAQVGEINIPHGDNLVHGGEQQQQQGDVNQMHQQQPEHHQQQQQQQQEHHQQQQPDHQQQQQHQQQPDHQQHQQQPEHAQHQQGGAQPPPVQHHQQAQGQPQGQAQGQPQGQAQQPQH